jgi:hypothetical protein
MIRKIVLANPATYDIRVLDTDSEHIPPIGPELPFGVVIEDAPDNQTAAFIAALRYVPWDVIEGLFNQLRESSYPEIRPSDLDTSKESIECLAKLMIQAGLEDPLRDYEWSDDLQAWV